MTRRRFLPRDLCISVSRRKGHERQRARKCGEMGSGNIRGGRIGRSATNGSTGQGGGGTGRKPLGLLAQKYAQLGRYAGDIPISGERGYYPRAEHDAALDPDAV